MVVCAELFGKGVLGITEADRCFSVAKLFFAYGLGNALYFPFFVGATSILWPGPPLAANVYQRDREAPADAVLLGADRLRDAAGAHAIRPGRRISICRASAWRSPRVRRCRRPCSIASNSASASKFSTASARPKRCTCSSPTVLARYGPARAASSSPATTRAFSTAKGEPVPAGEIGNLWIRGDSVCAGYWNRHDLTRDTIEGGWLRTGDKYTQDADGYYWYAGRSDDCLKVGGQWVSPIEVENALLAHPDVLECGVVGREDRDALVKPAAFVVLRDGRRGHGGSRCGARAVRARPARRLQAAALGHVPVPSCRRPRPARFSASSSASWRARRPSLPFLRSIRARHRANKGAKKPEIAGFFGRRTPSTFSWTTAPGECSLMGYTVLI